MYYSSIAERRLSKRSQRRLRQVVAERLAAQPPKKPRFQDCSERIELSSDRDNTQDPSSSNPQDLSPSPPALTPTGSLPSPPGPSNEVAQEPMPSLPGLSTEIAQEPIPDDDQSDVGEDSGEDSDCLGTLKGEVGLSDGGELISDSLSGDLSGEDLSDSGSENECFDYIPSSSIDSTGVPLYPDSSITGNGFNTLFLSLVQRHNLTYASQSDLLKFFSILLPSPSRVPCSSHMLISKFVNFKEDTIVQHFCGFCTHPIKSGSSSCEQQQCIEARLPRAMFVRIPLCMQLRKRFEGNV